jgi:hypothetical protein
MNVKAPGGGKYERQNHGGGGGSHNKPIGCGASGAYAPGPVDEQGRNKLTFTTGFLIRPSNDSTTD